MPEQGFYGGTSSTGGVPALEQRRSPWSDAMFLRRRRAAQKKMTGPSNGTETTIFQVASGAGIIDFLWMAIAPVGASGPNFDNRVRVYTDGNATPDIDQDAAVFFGYGKAANTFAQAAISSQHFSAKCNGTTGTQTHGAIRLPIFFTNGVKITLANTTNSTVPNIFAQVDYALVADNATMTVPPYRLKTSGVYNVNATLVAAGATATLHTLTGAGLIVAHSMCATSTSGLSYLEKQPALYIDGETVTPSVLSSGTEDWFADSWTFQNEGAFSRPGAMGFGATNSTPWPFSAVVDLLGLNGGYPFTTGVVMKWQAASDGNDVDPGTYADCLFYYLHT